MAHWQSAADDFAEGCQVRFYVEERLGAAEGYAEAGHYLVEDQKCAVAERQLAQCSEELGRGLHAAHVAGDWFDDGRGDFRPILCKSGFQAGSVVVLRTRVSRVVPSVTPGELGTPAVAAELPAATNRLLTWP